MEPRAFKRQWREDATKTISCDGLNTPEKKRLENDYFEPKTTLGSKALVSRKILGSVWMEGRRRKSGGE